MVPSSVWHALKAVTGLKKGRSEAPVRPVPEAHIEAIRPHVGRQVWAMVELQRLTGMRAGEVVRMRTADLDVTGEVWVYTPSRHKTEHHGKERRVYLGPAAQAILKPWLRPDLDSPLFRPDEAERKAALRAERKTKVQPSQSDRSKARSRRKPCSVYAVHAYTMAIRRATVKAGVPPWSAHRLRHNAATRLRREFGLDVTRAVLGHSTPVVTEVYAELDGAKAAEAMGKVG